jgi:hypothetical protein
VDGASILVNVLVELRLSLSTAAGRVKISEPVECLVIPGDSKEFLLGKDVLKSFGIDVERQIEQLAAKSMDERRACENEEPELGKNTEDKEELTDAICKLVEQAVMKGFPAEYSDELQLALTFGG